jgi:predicted ArsR family transcriptional regulator
MAQAAGNPEKRGRQRPAPSDCAPAPVTGRPSTAQTIERLVGALQDPTRRGILLAFYDHPGPRTVDDVAAAAGVHRTVAFTHLERLVSLRFLGTAQRRGVPGKPAKLYSLAAGPLELHHPARQFATLAGLLAAGLDRFGPPGVEAAREAGRRHAAMLCTTHADTPAQALQPLTLLGGSYAVENDRVLARNCIFREACAAAPDVICSLHAGMIEGALAAAGMPYRVEARSGDHEADCVYQLSAAS